MTQTRSSQKPNAREVAMNRYLQTIIRNCINTGVIQNDRLEIGPTLGGVSLHYSDPNYVKKYFNICHFSMEQLFFFTISGSIVKVSHNDEYNAILELKLILKTSIY